MRNVELKLRTADLIAQDRRAAGRVVGHIGEMRAYYEAMMRDLLKGLRSIMRTLNALYPD